MAEEINQENQKTIVSFVVGLLIGGLLVWAFSGPSNTDPKEMEDADKTSTEITLDATDKEASGDSPKELMVGEGDIVIADQPAGTSITMEKAVYPVSEGWIGVREFTDGELGFILGVNRFSESQGLVPSNIELIRSTTPGKTYAIVVFEEDGDFDFSLAGDKQLEAVFDTFTAE